MKKSGQKGMNKAGGTKARGRTRIPVGQGDVGAKRPTSPWTPQEVRREATRPVTAGSGKHRGDRRDTNPTFTTNVKHSARGNNPRAGRGTRKR